MYYETLRTVGEGSMGSISLARKREEHIGGSAYTRTRTGCFGRIVKEKRKPPTEVLDGGNTKLYALKSIILSRISVSFGLSIFYAIHHINFLEALCLNIRFSITKDEFVDELKNEITILQNLNHPNIVKAYEVYETPINIYLVLENCSGGDLYRRIPYSEQDSAKIVGKILSAISHMHMHRVTHRDLKFENIMFENESSDAEIKVIDFGLSTKLKKGKALTETAGTIYTMAPQVLRGAYNSQADLWSIGVIAYMLLSNTKPFYGKRRKTVVAQILDGRYTFYSSSWKGVSDDGKKFISELLRVDPNKRLNADKALAHTWLSTKFPLSARAPKPEIMDSIHETIINYGAVSEFKKMALMVLAHKSTTEEIVALRNVFDAFDTSNNGVISLEEFKAAMQKSDHQYSEEVIEQIFRSIDVGADGEVYYLEFLAATLEAHGRIAEERLAEAFDRIDSDDSGKISKKNLRDLLGKDYSEAKVDRMLQEVDMDNDGEISFDDFRGIFRAEQVKEERALMPESSHDIGNNERL
jgi:serine/threonine protein kinase